MTRLGLILTVLLGTSFLACAGSPESPRLVVLLVIDQMRADHLTRFAEHYEHGLAKLTDRGLVFTDAHHDHAITVTGAGHATLVAGVVPARHGVVGNSWFSPELHRNIYCAEDTTAALLVTRPTKPKDGRSPRTLLTPTFADWLKAAYPGSRIFGVARKDRASVLSCGASADGAFWYDSRNGNFITSDYYGDAAPDWVTAFNEARHVDRYFADGWNRVLPETAYSIAREDSFPTECGGPGIVFPHTFEELADKPNGAYYAVLRSTPFMDHLALDFARSAILEEDLGGDDAPDFLFVGGSAADAIGHSYGPFSQEAADYYFRLDRWLGEFLAFLDDRFGRDGYLFVLSSDHGAMPLAEELERNGIPAERIAPGRFQREINVAVRDAAAALGVDASVTTTGGPGIVLAVEGGEPSAELIDAVAAGLRENPLIADAYTRTELLAPDKTGRDFEDRFRNGFHPDRSGHVFVRVKEHCIIEGGCGTGHGSCYDFDTHVPLVIAGAGVSGGRESRRVRTVDLAPTLAALLGVPVPDGLDGIALLPARTPAP